MDDLGRRGDRSTDCASDSRPVKLRPYELTVGKAATTAYLSTWARAGDRNCAYDHMTEAVAYDRAQEIGYGSIPGLSLVEYDRWPWRIRYERVVAPEDNWPIHAGEVPCDCRSRRDPYCGTHACVGLPLVSCPT